MRDTEKEQWQPDHQKQKRIKVCFISFKAYPPFNSSYSATFGGAEVQFYLLARALAEDPSFEVSFIVEDVEQPHRETIHNVQVWKFDPKPRFLRVIKGVRVVPIVFRLFFLLRNISADIYIQRSAGVETGIIALFCRLFRKKFVYMVASQIDCSGEYEHKNGVFGKLFAFGLRHAHLIVVQHKNQQELLRSTYGLISTLLKSGYPIPAAITSHKESILWVGRCETGKHPEIFLQLAKQSPSEFFVMVIARSNDETLLQRIMQSRRSLPNLQLIQDVHFRDVDRYFQHAKLFINTSTYEGFPNTFVQAAKNKTPIISLNVNPDNFLNEYQCGFCAEGSFERMVEYVRLLLNNNTLWRKISENAYRYAKENHDINIVIPRFKSLLRELV